MSADRFPADCWFLTGPTASGKSAIAVSVAEQCNAEIIAMDSMTLYRGMDIGTAKPTAAERASIPHHLIDVLDPSDATTIAWYLDAAKEICADIWSRGKQPLFVGGTPLYLKACLRGMFDGPPANEAIRSALQQQASQVGVATLHAELAMFDPAAASKIASNDLRRIIRAIEVYRLTGKPISQWQEQFDRPADPLPKVACMFRPREELNQRIHDRVDEMIRLGWREEVRKLLERPRPMSKTAAQAAGYLELADDIRHRGLGVDPAVPEKVVELIKTRTRQLAKRQMTWFRHIAECQFFQASTSVEQLTVHVVAFFRHGAVQ